MRGNLALTDFEMTDEQIIEWLRKKRAHAHAEWRNFTRRLEAFGVVEDSPDESVRFANMEIDDIIAKIIEEHGGRASVPDITNEARDGGALINVAPSRITRGINDNTPPPVGKREHANNRFFGEEIDGVQYLTINPEWRSSEARRKKPAKQL